MDTDADSDTDQNTDTGDGTETDSVENICQTVVPPPDGCEAPDACGDGEVNLAGEECDDGNPFPGDGCNGLCKQEAGFLCPEGGGPCESSYACGNGVLEPNEICDDANTADSDGCSADCTSQEIGFICETPGYPCTDLNICGNGIVTEKEECDDGNTDPNDGCDACKRAEGFDCPWPGALCIPLCGDGIRILNEVCDDGNTEDGDGCSAACDWEEGWICDGEPGNYSCYPTSCGDGFQGNTEGCDDGNLSAGDGCSPFCKLEPVCPTAGGACSSSCGDGIIVGEACDDGNTVPGDGCSSTCTLEDGFVCTQPPLSDTMVVPVVYRDFLASHSDFQPSALGAPEAVTGIAADTLDTDGKPTYTGIPTDSNAAVESADSYAQWYRDVKDVNSTHAGTLTLFANGLGGYVNRYTEDGDRWVVSERIECAAAADASETPCLSEVPDDYPDCEDNRALLTDCEIDEDGNHWGIIDYDAMDGNPMFFPLDNVDGAITPLDEYYTTISIPPFYNPGYDPDTGRGTWVNITGEAHNFHFTSEVRYWFSYDQDETYQLDFTGDDDVWVFINRQLVVDLGGIHTPVSGGVTVDTAEAETLGLVDGSVYEMVVFQAERRTTCSSYMLTLSGFNASANECTPVCGDGVMTPGEQCDDGILEGGYGQCDKGCVIGPHCGDGEVNGPEECDNGVNDSVYTDTSEDACAPGCIKPPICGDGVVSKLAGEQCDDGVNNGDYGTCAPGCVFAPYCGDGVVQEGFEECDDRVNDGGYGECGVGCVIGPYCGDGEVYPGFEECDDGDDIDNNGCSNQCKVVVPPIV
jgi:fibro-slime domain-containing protein